eukprot:g12179.t1
MAEDVLQDVSLAAIKKADQIMDADHLAGWLRQAIRLRGMELRRKQVKQARLLAPNVLDLFEQAHQRKPADDAERMAALRHCIPKLGENAQRTLAMRYGEGVKPWGGRPVSNRPVSKTTADRFEAYLLGQLDDQAMDKLEEELRDDPQQAEECIAVMTTLAMVRELFRDQHQQAGELTKDPTLQSFHGLLGELSAMEEAAETQTVHWVGQVRVSRPLWQQWQFVIPNAIAALLAIAVVLIAALPGNTNTTTPSPITNAPSEPSSFGPVLNKHVATLTAERNAQWAEGALAQGSPMRAGQRFTLTQGFAEITTNHGAVAILEAPAAIELTNNQNAIQLHAGKLVGICETESSKATRADLRFHANTPDHLGWITIAPAISGTNDKSYTYQTRFDSDNYLLRESNSATPSFGETGGNATVNASSGGNSAMLLSLADLATNADVISSGELTISLTGVDENADFIAFNLVKADPGNPTTNTTFIATSNTLLGVLFRAPGNPQVFDQGTKVFDAAITPAYSDGGDVTIELTNITGLGTATGSFDYAILDDGVSVDTGTIAGDLSSLFFGIESRGNGASAVDSLSITTVPEPGSLALLGLGGLLIARRRRD